MPRRRAGAGSDLLLPRRPNPDSGITDAETKTLVYGYDELGRKTGRWQNQKTDTNKLAAWTFDNAPNAKGYPEAAVRYVGGTTGKAYTQKVTAYNGLYQPLSSELQLPPRPPMNLSWPPESRKP